MLAPTPYFADRGCHVRIYEEARALRQAGHDVRIVTYGLGRDMPGVPTVRIPSVPWYAKLEAGPSLHKIYLDALLLYKAAMVVPEFRPDLIHAHLHEGAAIGYLLKRLAGVPLLFDYQGSLTGECIDHGFFSGSSRAAGMFRRVENAINRGADAIITSSGSAADDLVSLRGIPAERVQPLLDAVDTGLFIPEAPEGLRASLGYSPDTVVVAYLGLLNRYQGTDLLLDSIGLLKSQGVQAQFLIMGYPDGHYRDEAARRGLEHMVRFTGRVDYKDAPGLLAAADIAVTPKLSPTEANGKLYNYMACALPVVSFDNPVNREVLGEAGIYARPADARDLAEKIALLVTTPQLRSDYAAKARRAAVERHSWGARIQQLTSVYASLCPECSEG